ncbi:esterase-like activity of phytase family protein [Bythopirellula goksoeyrii]|nr:esterase-like activity of phytase family protein [Bythopirellula goksoeyrii]
MKIKYCLLLFAVVFSGHSAFCQAANWNLAPPSTVLLDTSAVGAVSQMSGVTYLGLSPLPATTLLHRFAAVQNEGGVLLTFDVVFDPDGTLFLAKAVSSQILSPSFDFEGIAYTSSTRNSVYLAEENTPGVREFSLATGSQLQNVAIPPVFGNSRANRGFESLARSPDGTTMWTANEQALTVDGPLATSSAGTTVRLLRMDVAGDSVSPAEQYAYEVDPIHGTSTIGSPQSGLSDLVLLPDGTLLALERSVAFTSPLYLNRIYEVDPAGATDLSDETFDSGLFGENYVPVSKQILWSGAIDGSSGQNLEGLTLGPRLANGDWVLLGVVDDGDPVSQNTIVAFTLSANPSADFDSDGDIDGSDFLSWQRGVGISIGATHAEGDADRDGDVDADDLAFWQSAYSAPLSGLPLAVPEPLSNTLLLGLLVPMIASGRWRS